VISFSSVRVTYSVSWENFLATQRPFDFAATRGTGFFVTIFASLIAVASGVLIFAHHLTVEDRTVAEALGVSQIACFLIVAGGGVLAWLLVRDKRSAKREEREFEQVLRNRFEDLHCRDKRYIEAGPDVLSVGCACSETQVPWKNVRAVETPSGFVFATAKETVIVPKEAFPTEAERTQFRATLPAIAGEPSLPQGRAVNVQCSLADWKRARWLLFRAIAWKISFFRLFFAAGVGYLLVIASVAVDSNIVPDRSLIVGAVVIALIAFPLPLKQPPRYVGNFVASFSEGGIHLQFPWGPIAVDWHRIWKFAFDNNSLLIFLIDMSRLLIPRRCLGEAQWEIVRQLLESKVVRR